MKLIRMLMLVLFFSSILFPIASAQEQYISRGLPDNVQAGSILEVELDIQLGNETTYTIEEYVPEGWTITSASGGIISKSKDKVAWVALGTGSSGKLTYETKIPLNANGVYQFSGLYGIGKDEIQPIDSESKVTVVGGNPVSRETPMVSILLTAIIIIIALLFSRTKLR